MERDEALAELTRRYFTSHGPATLRDFVWWSGLTMGDARRGVEIVGRALVRETMSELTCWSAPSASAPSRGRSAAYLLPIYDEYLIAYKDRGVVTDPASTGRAKVTLDVYAHWLIVDGYFTGTWRRAETAAGVEVTVTPHRSLTAPERKAIGVAAERYSAFLETAVVVRGLGKGAR